MNQANRHALELQLKHAEATIEDVRKKLAAPEPVVPWSPPAKGNTCYLDSAGEVRNEYNQYSGTIAYGGMFATREAATKASKFFTFYQRLYQLALECAYTNFPKTGNHGVWFNCRDRKWETTTMSTMDDVGSFFTSKEAAQEACDIMNRDGWVLPTM